MRRLIKFFTDIRVLSLIFAVILWFYVVGTQGPTISKVINDIPVIPVNVPSGTFVSTSLGTVSATVEGPGKVIIGLRDSDYSAIVDLSNKKSGIHLVSVEVRPPTASVVVKSVSPEQISVPLEKLSTRTISVAVEFVNSSSSGFIPDIPIVSPESVTVSGPESTIAMISRAYVSLDLTNVSENSTYTLPVKVEVKDKEDTEDIYVNPSTVVVEIKKSKNDISVMLPIIPNLSGISPKGFGVRSVSVSPNFVMVTGSPDAVKKITEVSTLPIDISKLLKNTTIEINLVPAEGTKLNIEKCKVDIVVQPVQTIKITLPLTFIYDEGKNVSSSIASVDIVISSFKDILDTLNRENIKAKIDATGIGSGSYSLPVTISGLPESVILNQISPQEVGITIY